MNAFSSTGKGSQKYLGNKGLIALIALLSAFPPLSTDLYLPALPTMSDYFGVTVQLTNQTLVLFFLFYAIGTLVWGPLSDKYGRKVILVTGLVIYILGSLLCTVASTVQMLILCRIFQAIGGSSATAVATAIVKDVYEGRKRETVLAIVQSMVVIAPALAPIFGAWLLSFTSWRGVFAVLSGIGSVALTGSFFLQETIIQRQPGTIVHTMSRLVIVLKNKGFRTLLMIFSIPSIAVMAYVASSSYIYEKQFGLSAQAYSFYYALNAAGLTFAPLLYLLLSKHFQRRIIIYTCFSVVALGGLLIFLLGPLHPLLFAFTLLPTTIAGSSIRTPGTNLMLEQQQEDAGSASSLIGCFGILMGSIGMTIVSFNWSNLVRVVGILNIILGLLCGFLWITLSRKSYIRQVPERISGRDKRIR